MISEICCEICCEDYTCKVTPTKESCQYFCDTGEFCKKTQNKHFCSIHESQRIPIKCSACSKQYCNSCYKQYFLQIQEEPKCVSCNKTFDLEYLLDSDENNKQRFTCAYVWGPLKKHRENILLEEVILKLPKYQTVIENRILKKKRDQEIKEMRNKIVSLYIRNSELCKNKKVDELTFTEREEYNMNSFMSSYLQRSIDRKNVEVKTSYVTHGKCIKKGCNGLVNNMWSCGICETQVCSKCYVLKDADHVCNKDDVNSLALVRQISRPCPNCNQMIERTEGCHQMWCTMCHIFFSWTTGNIIKKTQHVHNPEYVDWLKKSGATKCGEFNTINYEQVINMFPNNDTIIEYYRISNEITEEIQNFENNTDKGQQKHAINYLLGNTTKDALKRSIQRTYKSQKKEQMACVRKNWYVQCIHAIITAAMLSSRNNNYVIAETEKSLKKITVCFKDSMAKIGQIFNSSCPPLSKSQHRRKMVRVNLMCSALKRFIDVVNFSDTLDTDLLNDENMTALMNITGTRSDIELHNYLKVNKDWIPSKEDIKNYLACE